MITANTHAMPRWMEVEYSGVCKNPYLLEPIFVPKVSTCFLCGDNEEREAIKMIFLVFKSTSASQDDDWEDDPMVGEMYVNALVDDDEEVTPAKTICLGVDAHTFCTKVAEDDSTITFAFSWRYGTVKVDKAKVTSEGFVCKKEDFGEEGLRVVLTPDDGAPFCMHLTIPYIGFSLHDAAGKRCTGEVVIPHDKLDDYSYSFVGNDSNDRFSIDLDGERLKYLCVLRDNGTLAVRDVRNRLAIVKEIKGEGPLADLLMGAHKMLVKNKNNRWRISLEGTSLEGAERLTCSPQVLVEYAANQYADMYEGDEATLATQLLALEQKYAFQWLWLREEDWNTYPLKGFDLFMRQLVAFSYINQKTIQGDALQTRNNMRKITRCAKWVKGHQDGTLNIWDMEEDSRREILHLFSSYHQAFVTVLESL